MEKENFSEKISKYREAIDTQDTLRFLVEDQSKSSTKDTNARYWLSVFHSEYLKPNHYPEKAIHSVIFLYDHNTGKSLCLQRKITSDKKELPLNFCKFAKFFEDRSLLVVQFEKEIILYQLNKETLLIKKTLSSKDTEYKNHVNYFTNVVIENSGLGYLACLDQNKRVTLIEFDFEKDLILFHELKHHWSHYDSIQGLFIKLFYKKQCEIIVLKMKNKISGYAVFGNYSGKNSEPDYWLYEETYSPKLALISKVLFYANQVCYDMIGIIFYYERKGDQELIPVSETTVPIKDGKLKRLT